MRDPLALVRAAAWNAGERRPRAPLRLLGHTVLLVVALVVFSLGLGLVRGPTPFAGLSPLGALALQFVLVGGAVVVATLVAVRVLDRRPFAGVGLGVDRAWWRDLAAGLALGAALQTGIFLTSVGAGWTRVGRVGGAGVVGGLALGAVVMAAVGFYEELWFRGYYLTNVAEGLRAVPRVDARRATLAATALTSLGFGVVHATNPNATPVSSALVAGYGVYLAVGYLLTGDLALPVGFHASWNYVQGFVYGLPVSGLNLEASLLGTRTAGPAVLTGGPFGPEAGLVGLAWVLASLPAIWWWVRRTRGEVGLRVGIAVPDRPGVDVGVEAGREPEEGDGSQEPAEDGERVSPTADEGTEDAP